MWVNAENYASFYVASPAAMLLRIIASGAPISICIDDNCYLGGNRYWIRHRYTFDRISRVRYFNATHSNARTKARSEIDGGPARTP